ncbi:MAG: hypothetical protein ACE361_09990 [Aureliella sp.]
MQNYARISTFGILALVALRVTIGWHFYMEGATKVRGNGFSSSGFLQAAKGPLADKFQNLIWDHEGRLRLDQPKMNGLLERATNQVVTHFGFTDEQKKELEELRPIYFGVSGDEKRWVGKLNDVYAENQEEIFKYWESTERLESMDDSSTWTEVSSLRGQKEKIENDRKGDVQEAVLAVDAIWQQYEQRLNDIATDAQQSRAGYFTIKRPGQGLVNSGVADKVIPIFDMAVGILLMIGLLTPLAAWAAALFLISVVLSQMPGFPGTDPTYFQAVEAIACITLATCDAGRYAGLDFLPWSWWQNKEKTEAATA